MGARCVPRRGESDVSVRQTEEARNAQLSPVGKLMAETPHSSGRYVAAAMLVLGVGLMLYLAYARGGEAEADDGLVLKEEHVTAAELERRARFARQRPEDPPVDPPLSRPDDDPEDDSPEEADDGIDWAWVRSRSADSMVAIPAASTNDGPREGASPTPATAHVPRGTVMSALLESRIRSDNLDSRVRATLLEDLVIGGEVIFPAGGRLNGEAFPVASRYQDRVAVRIFNYVYPDGSGRELPFDGLLLNRDASAHLMADDKRHHTGKLITAIGVLEGLRAATGLLGGGEGNDVLVNLGNGVAGGVQSVAEPKLQHVLQIVPTLIVEPGKPVFVYVDESFDCPAFSRLPAGGVPARQTSQDAGPADPYLSALMEQIQHADAVVTGLGSLGPAGPMPALPPGGLPGGR